MKFSVNFLTSLSLGDWITILFVTIIIYISLFYYEYYTPKIHGEIFEIWVGLQRQIVLSSAELIEQLNVPSAKVGDLIEVFDYAVTNPSYLHGTFEMMQ
ncbi:10030_t:CDS:2 [Ambispora leptoticha]|uniref:10030_t:CDS:1 n=1 Tax=Ambispora leptoticha TaxID=144679 RepID=A0A9N9G602_9GLOM|nr:10030_t:CDS:2 [Ambispora leptoticha]